MKSKKVLQKINNKGVQTEKLTWKTVDQVFKKTAKKTAFQRAYHAETERIKLARTIREARLKRNLTQHAVAKRAHMPQSVIARIESGKHSVSVETLGKIANALGKQIQLV